MTYLVHEGLVGSHISIFGKGIISHGKGKGNQALNGAAERNEKMVYLCYDNEGYMNTGIQRSSATPYYVSTTTTPVGKVRKGKQSGSKNLPLVMSMHDIP